MARSTYVYVLVDAGKTVACFTVKRECLAYAKRHTLPLYTTTVERYLDGQHRTPFIMTLYDFLVAERERQPN